MRRLKMELYDRDRGSLILLRKQIDQVLKFPLIDGKPPRLYVGATDGVVRFQRWHLDDAVSIIRHGRVSKAPPKPSPKAKTTRPPRAKPKALIVLEPGQLKIIQRKAGATCWTTIPATSEAPAPTAFKITYEHLAHISDNWLAAWGDAPGRGGSGRESNFRLSAADELWEFFEEDPDGARHRQIRVPVEPAKTDVSQVWAVPRSEGVEFDAGQLASAMQLLLEATRHVGREIERLKASGGQLPAARGQDFASLHVDDGVARAALRTCNAEVEAPGLKGLRFSIGRQDAKALARALRLMTISRRTAHARKHKIAAHPPRWSKFGDLHVITNGDVGFAFREATGAPPARSADHTWDVLARLHIDLSSEHRYLPWLQLVEDDLSSGLGLVHWGDAYALVSLGERGQGRHAVEFKATGGGLYPPPQQFGPHGQISFRLTDVMTVLGTLYGDAINAEILDVGGTIALRLARAVGDLNFSAWLAAIPSSHLAEAYRRRPPGRDEDADNSVTELNWPDFPRLGSTDHAARGEILPPGLPAQAAREAAE